MENNEKILNALYSRMKRYNELANMIVTHASDGALILTADLPKYEECLQKVNSIKKGELDPTKKENKVDDYIIKTEPEKKVTKVVNIRQKKHIKQHSELYKQLVKYLNAVRNLVMNCDEALDDSYFLLIADRIRAYSDSNLSQHEKQDLINMVLTIKNDYEHDIYNVVLGNNRD